MRLDKDRLQAPLGVNLVRLRPLARDILGYCKDTLNVLHRSPSHSALGGNTKDTRVNGLRRFQSLLGAAFIMAMNKTQEKLDISNV